MCGRALDKVTHAWCFLEILDKSLQPLKVN